MKGRRPTIISKEELQLVIDELESKFTFPSLNALWKAVEQTEWAKSAVPRPVTYQVAALRARELGITTKTTAGKKGGANFLANPRRKRMLNAEQHGRLRKEFPNHGLAVDKCANGSMRAAIKLKCLECTCGSKKEIRICNQVTCPLWLCRPYKKRLTILSN